MAYQFGTNSGQAIPLPARVLGIASVIPFTAGALALALTPQIKPEAAAVLLAYGAMILSFLGGVRGGFAVLEDGEAGWSSYSMSALPAFVAWLGAAAGGPLGLLILAIALGLWYFAERAAPPSIVLPDWYMRLRGSLTVIAVLSLIVGAVSW